MVSELSASVRYRTTTGTVVPDVPPELFVTVYVGTKGDSELRVDLNSQRLFGVFNRYRVTNFVQ